MDLQTDTGSRNHITPGRHLRAALHGCMDLPHPGMSLKWWLQSQSETTLLTTEHRNKNNFFSSQEYVNN